MAWSKLKQQLDSFLAPALHGTVEYRATGYRYSPDTAGLCYITVNKKNIFNMSDLTTGIRWYQTEMDVRNDASIQIPISEEELDAVRLAAKGTVPEHRLLVIARNRKSSEYAKKLISAQTALSKSNFYFVANQFLSNPIEQSLECDDILLNILALVDRRVGKNRIINRRESMETKHPVVKYVYRMRLDV